MYRRCFVYRIFIKKAREEKKYKKNLHTHYILFEQIEPSNMTKAKEHIGSYKNRIFRIGIGKYVCIYIVKIVDNAYIYIYTHIQIKVCICV